MTSEIIQIPKCVAELRKPWLENVPEHLQHMIRFAAQVDVDAESGRKSVQEYMSGGQGTIISKQLSKPHMAALEKAIRAEYLPRQDTNPDAFERFRVFMAEKGVAVSAQSKSIPKEALDIAQKIYSILPAEHLGNEHFNELVLGGWGNGQAKTSSHDGGKVHLFNFAIKGPKRNYTGLLLHETGHAHFHQHREKIAECINGTSGLITKEGIAKLGIDYLMGRESRGFETQPFRENVDEFAAEMYLLYVAKGISMKKRFETLSPKKQFAWSSVYSTFRECFGGTEYDGVEVPEIRDGVRVYELDNLGQRILATAGVENGKSDHVDVAHKINKVRYGQDFKDVTPVRFETEMANLVCFIVNTHYKVEIRGLE